MTTNQEEKEHYGPGQIDGVPTEDAINKQNQDNRRNNEIIDHLKEGAKHLPDDVLYDEVKKTDPDFGYPQQESWESEYDGIVESYIRLEDAGHIPKGAVSENVNFLEIKSFIRSIIQSEREVERKSIGEWLLNKTAGGAYLSRLADHLITGQELDDFPNPT